MEPLRQPAETLDDVLSRLDQTRQLAIECSGEACDRLFRVFIGGGDLYLHPTKDEMAADPTVRPERLDIASLSAIVSAAEDACAAANYAAQPRIA